MENWTEDGVSCQPIKKKRKYKRKKKGEPRKPREHKEIIIPEDVRKEIMSEPFDMKLIGVNECAEFLGLSKHTIYKKVESGDMPFLKENRKLYFRKRSLIQWLELAATENYDL